MTESITIPLTKKELRAKDYNQKNSLVPIKLSDSVFQFIVYGFKQYDIFVSLRKPTFEDLALMNISTEKVTQYTSHKNYEYSTGRCKRFPKSNTIIVSLDDTETKQGKILTAMHELNHCSHRILEDIKETLSNYEEAHCIMQDYLMEQYLYITTKTQKQLFKTLDLTWFKVVTHN